MPTTMLYGALLTAFGSAGAAIADARGVRTARTACKIAASLGFLAVAFSSWRPGAMPSPLQLGTLAAAVGDAALTGRSRQALAGGIVTFSAAHLAYAAGFGLRIAAAHPRPATLAAAAAVLGIALAVGHAAWTRLAPHAGRLRGAVRAYTALVTLMCGLAVAAFVALAATPTRWIALAAAIGATCFCASDVAVARDRLLGPSMADRRWGLPLYHVAQLLIAWAAASGY